MSVIDFLSQRPSLVKVHFPMVEVSAPRTGVADYYFEPGANITVPSPALTAPAGAWFLIDSLTWRLAPAVSEDDYSGALIPKPSYTDGVKRPLAARFYWGNVQGGGAQALASVPLLRYYTAFPLRLWTKAPSNSGVNPLSVDISGGVDASDFTGYTPEDFLTVRLTARIFEIQDRDFNTRLDTLGIGGVGMPYGEPGE